MFLHKRFCVLNITTHLTINDNIRPIQKVNNISFVGIFFDTVFSWEIHIKHVKKKVVPIIGALNRSLGINNKLLKNIYY